MVFSHHPYIIIFPRWNEAKSFTVWSLPLKPHFVETLVVSMISFYSEPGSGFAHRVPTALPQRGEDWAAKQKHGQGRAGCQVHTLENGTSNNIQFTVVQGHDYRKTSGKVTAQTGWLQDHKPYKAGGPRVSSWLLCPHPRICPPTGFTAVRAPSPAPLD